MDSSRKGGGNERTFGNPLLLIRVICVIKLFSQDYIVYVQVFLER